MGAICFLSLRGFGTRVVIYLYICRNVSDKICRQSGFQGRNGVFEGVATTAAEKWLRRAELSRGVGGGPEGALGERASIPDTRRQVTHAQHRRASASGCRSDLVEIYASAWKNFNDLALAGLLS